MGVDVIYTYVDNNTDSDYYINATALSNQFKDKIKSYTQWSQS